jgi:hypothetical protein
MTVSTSANTSTSASFVEPSTRAMLVSAHAATRLARGSNPIEPRTPHDTQPMMPLEEPASRLLPILAILALIAISVFLVLLAKPWA